MKCANMKQQGVYMMLLCSFLIFSQIKFGNGFDVSFTDVTEILRLGREAVVEALESWEFIRPKLINTEGEDFPFVKRMEKEIKSRIVEVSNKIDQYNRNMELRTDAILAKLLHEIPLEQAIQNTLRQFDQYIGQVNSLYEQFEKYASALDLYEKYTMEDFARACVSARLGGLPDVLKTIHRMLVQTETPTFQRNILMLLAQQMQEVSSQICNEQQSPQQLLYNLYTSIALTEIKGYTMIQFSYMLLREYNKGSNFSEEMNSLKQQYTERTFETLRAVKTAMAFAPRDVWKCDPVQHKEGETYAELKQLFQGYIINEVDMNGDSSCRENCAYYGYAKVHGCYQNQFCSQQRRCNGKLWNCEYVDSDMWICPSDKRNDRRYEYIEYENNRVFGRKDTCSRGTTKVDSWWRWLFWHCSYCFCYCDDHNSSSDRYFSLRPVIADIANNKAITGIRLVKKNHIVFVQIKESELLPRGQVNVTTGAWKPIDSFTVMDAGIKNGVDYHTLVWEKRALDLDNLLPHENHLLTGVRFRVIGTRLNLEIMVTPYNFTSGKLIQPSEKSFWHSNDNTDRTELKYDHPDIPTRTSAPSMPDTMDNQYLNFAPSDRELDAAQSTIPFLDIQPVEPKPPVPIAGAGIYHKGRKSSGGFVALKLFTYDFSQHLQADVPPPSPVIDTINEITTV